MRGLGASNGINPVGGNNGETIPQLQDFLLSDANRVVAAGITGASRQTLDDDSLLKEHLRVELKRFIQKRTGAKPVITFVIVRA